MPREAYFPLQTALRGSLEVFDLTHPAGQWVPSVENLGHHLQVLDFKRPKPTHFIDRTAGCWRSHLFSGLLNLCLSRIFFPSTTVPHIVRRQALILQSEIRNHRRASRRPKPVWSISEESCGHGRVTSPGIDFPRSVRPVERARAATAGDLCSELCSLSPDLPGATYRRRSLRIGAVEALILLASARDLLFEQRLLTVPS